MFLCAKEETRKHKWTKKNGETYDREVKVTMCYFVCDECKKKFTRRASDIHKKRWCDDYKHFCSDCFDQEKVALIGKKKRIANLENKIGNKWIDSSGYVNVYIGPESSDKRAHQSDRSYGGSIREHILVMEQSIGRKLDKGEVVHHIDGDKTNNDIENLDLCSVEQHNLCHAKSEEIVFELYKKGMVEYDRKAKRYRLMMES